MHAHIHILVQQPTLYISSSEAALHTADVGLQRRETQSPAYVYSCNNLHYTFLPARLLYTATDARLRRRGIHSPAYVYRCNNLCCAYLPAILLCTPQMLDYEVGKRIAPHTYTNATAYAVLFFQRGYSAHPQILNYEGIFSLLLPQHPAWGGALGEQAGAQWRKSVKVTLMDLQTAH